MTQDELYRQNTNDLLTIIKIQMAIIAKYGLTAEDIKRIGYCTKVLNDVTTTQKKINALP